MKKKFINKIKYELISFHNLKKRTEITTQIEIDKKFKKDLEKNYNLNESRFKESEDFIKNFELKRYFKNENTTDHHTYEINRIEFKFLKVKEKSIKNKKVIKMKSPIFLSIRMIKTRV